MRRVVRTLGVFFVCSAAVPIAVTVTVLAAFLFLPLPAALPQPRAGVESRISHIFAIDAKGKAVEIGVFRKFDQKIPVNRADIPLILKQALISAEDRNFYKHGGVDLRGSFRALWADLRKQGVVQGGSTLTQQYVKNAYTDKDRTITRKVREAILASQLDRQFDKDEILFRYLSDVYLGEGAYGVGAASETYFRKPVNQLTLSEAAMLVGLIPAPSYYEPRGNPQGAESKRQLVLKFMLEQGYIDQAQHDQAVAQPVWLAVQGKPPGPVTLVYPPLQQQTQFPYFVDYVKKYLVARFGADKVERGGLQIQTTLDPEMQKDAEASVANALKGTAPPLEMALAAVEPPTGYVKALVGGRDFYNTTATYGQVNLALGFCPPKSKYPEPQFRIEVKPACWDDPDSLTQGGGSGRQPGSSWKPFVLAAA
jgi:penicillin-binding protein 1A